jgi:hypothetical protein
MSELHFLSALRHAVRPMAIKVREPMGECS